jgi:cell division control protein 6
MFRDQSSDSGILRNQQHLSTTYQPESPIRREGELEAISASLKPLAEGQQPKHLLVHGPAGVGKSTTVQHVFDQLNEHTRVKTVTINCWQYNTRSSLVTELLIQLGYPAPRKGKPVDALLSRLREWLDKNHEVALALEEFDQLTEMNQVAYDLFLLNEKADHNLGTVMLSNQPAKEIELEPRTDSRLSYDSLSFDSYNTDELIQILTDRVEQAFRPGTISDGSIKLIADHAARSGGDCRQALESLLDIGRKAEQQDEDKITTSFVREILDWD